MGGWGKLGCETWVRLAMSWEPFPTIGNVNELRSSNNRFLSIPLSLLSYFSIQPHDTFEPKTIIISTPSSLPPSKQSRRCPFLDSAKSSPIPLCSSLRHRGVLDPRNPNPLHVPSVRNIRKRITANQHQIRAAPRLNHASICEAKVLRRP